MTVQWFVLVKAIKANATEDQLLLSKHVYFVHEPLFSYQCKEGGDWGEVWKSLFRSLLSQAKCFLKKLTSQKHAAKSTNSGESLKFGVILLSYN